MSEMGSVRQRQAITRGTCVRSATLALALVVASACGRAPISGDTTPTPLPTASQSAQPTASSCPSSVLPAARFGAAGAFDQNSGSMVVFGGDGIASTTTGALASMGDTWTWSDGCWSMAQPADAPSPRAYAVMAYDPTMKHVMLFGGQHEAAGAGPIAFNDTWIWNGTSWTELPLTGPSLKGAVGAFDTAREELVVFGWSALDGSAQTWTLKGNRWIQAKPASSPPARGQPAIAYDPPSQLVILFGGFSEGLGLLNDTWSWDGTTWRNAKPAHSPSPRLGASLCAAGSTDVLFGGDPDAADTWVWSGSDWAPVTTAVTPSGRQNATCVSSPQGRAIFFAGVSTTQLLNDVWVWNSTAWTT